MSSYEPRHDKTNKMSVRPAKTPISVGIRAVWSESSLCAEWVTKDTDFLHADNEDSDQSGPRWAHTHFVGFVMSRLIWVHLFSSLDPILRMDVFTRSQQIQPQRLLR